jgi:hypothetical protein
MARVNALRAKSAENEKAKEAAKQAVASQETLVDAVIAKTDEDDKVKEEAVQSETSAADPEPVSAKQDPVFSVFASVAKNGKRTIHKNFLLSDKAAANLERAYKTLGYKSANDFMNTILEDLSVNNS